MKIHSLQFKGYSCFKSEWSSVPSLKPFCVIIGKNNTGKSHYLKVIEKLCKVNPADLEKCTIIAEAILDEGALKTQFEEHLSGGELGGYNNHWIDHGKEFKDEIAIWDNSNGDDKISFTNNFHNKGNWDPDYLQKCLLRIKKIFLKSSHTLHGRLYRQLLADRDIQPEIASNKIELAPNGAGATNLVHKYLNLVTILET